MCLSTVYKKEGGENVFLCKNVARVIPKGDEIALYDLMGNKTVIDGVILDVDLMENIILVKENER